MGISKTYINRSLDTLYDWLVANSTDYFTSVVKNTSDISCYVDDVKFFKISFNAGCTITTKYGSSTRISSSYSNNFLYAIKATNALAFCSEKSGGANNFGVIITKDNNDKVAAVIIGQSSTSNAFKPVPNSSNEILSVSIESESINSVTVYQNTGTTVTSLCPMIVCGTLPRYLPNIFVTAFSQYDHESKYQISNTIYYSNGLTAIKDE